MASKTTAARAAPTKKDLAQARRDMVTYQIAGRGVHDPKLLDAMGRVPREAFVSENLIDLAYEDTPLPIEAGQTISQPYIVAYMIAALNLKGGERVLEIGTGSGYGAAVLGQIAGEVYSVERIKELADLAARRLKKLKYHNVHVIHGNGTLGWPEAAPYGGIVVTAGGPEVPPALKEQLAIGGRLVIPVGATPRLQELMRITRAGESTYKTEDLAGVRFVPLIGEQGWTEEDTRAELFFREGVTPRKPKG